MMIWPICARNTADAEATMKTLRQVVPELPVIDRVMVMTSDNSLELYEDRKWISGRFDRNIGIDQPTHGVGQQHAHVYGRKRDDDAFVVVNFDGTASHGKRGRLPDEDADALRARGYAILDSNIVEWTILLVQPQLLLE
jgi:hypothetical protein